MCRTIAIRLESACRNIAYVHKIRLDRSKTVLLDALHSITTALPSRSNPKMSILPPKSVENASVSGGVAGAISYTATPSGGQATAITASTILAAGSYTLAATFTPADPTDYSRVTSQTSYTVNQATPIITWASPAAITFGAALSSTQLQATLMWLERLLTHRSAEPCSTRDHRRSRSLSRPQTLSTIRP
jgi:hypothetical protein